MPALTSILLVDDDATTNFLNKLLLQTMQVAEQVLIAENGAEALQTLHRTCTTELSTACPQLILLDMNMPVMNGLAFLEAYTQIATEQRQSTVIVMLTTSLHERDLTRARAMPIAGFLDKPLTRDKVTAVLQQHFAK